MLWSVNRRSVGKYYQISLHAMLQSTWHAIFTVASYYSFTDGARTKRITVFTLVFTVIVPWTTVEQRVFKSCEECPTGVQWDIFPSFLVLVTFDRPPTFAFFLSHFQLFNSSVRIQCKNEKGSLSFFLFLFTRFFYLSSSSSFESEHFLPLFRSTRNL